MSKYRAILIGEDGESLGVTPKLKFRYIVNDHVRFTARIHFAERGFVNGYKIVDTETGQLTASVRCDEWTAPPGRPFAFMITATAAHFPEYDGSSRAE